MFGIGIEEVLVILVLALIFLGPERLPEVAAQAGKALREYRRLTGSLHEELGQLLSDTESMGSDARSGTQVEAPAIPGPPAIVLHREVIDAGAALVPPIPSGEEAAAAFRERRRRGRYDGRTRARRGPRAEGRPRGDEAVGPGGRCAGERDGASSDASLDDRRWPDRGIRGYE